jgi:hypothetical protein
LEGVEHCPIYNKLAAHVEVDETCLDSKARDMHLKQRDLRIKGTGGTDKVYTDALKSYKGLEARLAKHKKSENR